MPIIFDLWPKIKLIDKWHSIVACLEHGRLGTRLYGAVYRNFSFRLNTLVSCVTYCACAGNNTCYRYHGLFCELDDSEFSNEFNSKYPWLYNKSSCYQSEYVIIYKCTCINARTSRYMCDVFDPVLL